LHIGHALNKTSKTLSTDQLLQRTQGSLCTWLGLPLLPIELKVIQGMKPERQQLTPHNSATKRDFALKAVEEQCQSFAMVF